MLAKVVCPLSRHAGLVDVYSYHIVESKLTITVPRHCSNAQIVSTQSNTFHLIMDQEVFDFAAIHTTIYRLNIVDPVLLDVGVICISMVRE